MYLQKVLSFEKKLNFVDILLATDKKGGVWRDLLWIHKLLLGGAVSYEFKMYCSPPPTPKQHVMNSVADPGCLSRIPDPDFYPSQIPIPDLRSRIQKQVEKRGVKKYFLSNIFL